MGGGCMFAKTYTSHLPLQLVAFPNRQPYRMYNPDITQLVNFDAEPIMRFGNILPKNYPSLE